MKNWGNLSFHGFSSMGLTCITRKIWMTGQPETVRSTFGLTSGKRRVTRLEFRQERRANDIGMQSRTLKIVCGVRSKGNGLSWELLSTLKVPRSY